MTPKRTRRLMQTRRIVCEGWQRDDGLYDIEASLEDVKPYAVEVGDRPTIAAGEPFHHMRLRIAVDTELRIHEAEATTTLAPYHACHEIDAAYARLVGLRLGAGFQRAVRERLGAWAAEDGARAGASRGASLGAGEACGGPTQRAGNDGWCRESPRPEGLGLQGGACVVAPLAQASSLGGAPRLASTPLQAQREPRSLPPTLPGGRAGCTHLTELLAQVVTTAMQTVWHVLDRLDEPKAERPLPWRHGERPAEIDGCHALRSDGDAVRRHYPPPGVQG